jgi:hypothetical protein
MVSDKLPPHIELELAAYGIKPAPKPPTQQQPKYTYRKPVFDENGEPDF